MHPILGKELGSAPLFVTDLDFTLLRSDASLSSFAMDAVNTAVAAGHLFTFATARSFTSASKVTAGLDLRLPVLTYGGAVTVDPQTAAILSTSLLAPKVVEAIVEATAESQELDPVFYAIVDGRDRLCWRPDHGNDLTAEFIAARAGDPRLMPIDDWSQIPEASVFFVTIIGERDPVVRLQGQLAPFFDDCFSTVVQDGYDQHQTWFEISALSATKGERALALKEQLAATSLVVFGDGLNDVPLFDVADHRCAVGNAASELRDLADEVLATNDEDGVAQWLRQHLLRDDTLAP